MPMSSVHKFLNISKSTVFFYIQIYFFEIYSHRAKVECWPSLVGNMYIKWTTSSFHEADFRIPQNPPTPHISRGTKMNRRNLDITLQYSPPYVIPSQTIFTMHNQITILQNIAKWAHMDLDLKRNALTSCPHISKHSSSIFKAYYTQNTPHTSIILFTHGVTNQCNSSYSSKWKL